MISIIVPVLNEINNISEIQIRLRNTLLKYNNFEIIFIDDGSTDGTRKKLEEVCVKYNYSKCIFFDKNYGHQMALLAGLKYSKGDIIITIDGDLSDPPELIEKLIDLNKEGYDIVNTIRKKRENEKVWRIFCIKSFYFFCDLFNLSVINNSGDFRLINRKALNLLLAYPYKKFFIRALIGNLAVKQHFLKYDRKPRRSGLPKGSFFWLCKFGIDCLIALKILPKFVSFTPDKYTIEKTID